VSCPCSHPGSDPGLDRLCRPTPKFLPRGDTLRIKLSPPPACQPGAVRLCEPVAVVGSGKTYQVFPGYSAPMALGPPGPYAPKSNRATGSAYRLVEDLDWHTSLVATSRDSPAGRDWSKLIGCLRARGVGYRVGSVRESLPSHLRTYRRDPTRRRVPGSVGFPVLEWLRGRSERRSPFGLNVVGSTAAVA
jgi:hypothetical protein